MHQITSAQFKAAVQLDPAWASKLTKPVEITDYCSMERSAITHLSPLLHFTGKNEYGHSANFSYGTSLKIAEGKFEGFVSFWESSIEKIRDLSCEKNIFGIRLNVEGCKNVTKIPISFNPTEIEADPKLIEKLEVDRFIQKKRAEIVEIEI